MMLQNIIYYGVFPLLCGAFMLGFVRLVLGPTLPDRIMAFELVSTSSAGIIVTYAVASDVPLLLDVASVWAIISFLSVIAFAYYIERWRAEP